MLLAKVIFCVSSFAPSDTRTSFARNYFEVLVGAAGIALSRSTHDTLLLIILEIPSRSTVSSTSIASQRWFLFPGLFLLTNSMAIMLRQYVPADAVQSVTEEYTPRNDASSEVRTSTWSICRASPKAFLQPSLTLLSLQNPNCATLTTISNSEPVKLHPDLDFFKHVSPDGYPEQEAIPAKSQPWRKVWDGPRVSKDGRLLIACPKGCDWGKNI